MAQSLSFIAICRRCPGRRYFAIPVKMNGSMFWTAKSQYRSINSKPFCARAVLPFAPRGTAHTIQNFGPAAAQMLVMVTPGRLQEFVEELSSLNKGVSTPDLVRAEQLMNQYGMELLGPPLT